MIATPKCRWCRWTKFDRKAPCVNVECSKPAKLPILKAKTLPMSVFTKHGFHALATR